MTQYQRKPTPDFLSLQAMISALDVVRPKDFYFAGEMHDFWEMVCVADGQAIATADERVYSLSRGQLLFHKPLEFHRVWSAGDSAPRLLLLSFQAQGAGMEYFRERLISLDGYRLELLLEITSSLRQALLRWEANPAAPAAQCAYRLSVLELEHFLLTLYGKSEKKPGKSPLCAQAYEQIVSLLSQHCREALSLSQAASLCGMSQSNLKRVFSLYSEKGVMEYFQTLKVREALRLLEQGHSIARISEMLHYSSPSYFHVVFKRVTGLTPRQYLRQKG